MKIVSLLWLLLKHLPELLELIDRIDASIEKAKAERQMSDDLKVVSDAFKNQDPEALRRLFSNTSA